MVIILMGVSGCGKTTVGRLLAKAIDGIFQDGDWFHPSTNIAKMSNGKPLDDTDRELWLDILSNAIGYWLAEEHPYILACSALKQDYRERLIEGRSKVKIVYLRGSKELIQKRLEERKSNHHFMPSSLLESQFAALEEPRGVPTIDIDKTPDEIVSEIIQEVIELDKWWVQ